MEMKCGEFQKKLERLKSDFEYAKRLIKDFERTGKEEEENIQWIIQNVENSASWFREKLTTSSEAEAREIMGQDLFVGTEIAEKIFGGMKPFERRIPFSRAELIQAKLEGKILLYRPGYSLRGPPMTIEGMITNIQFNDPLINTAFFTGEHRFDFGVMLNMTRNHSLGRMEMEKSSWNLIQIDSRMVTAGEADKIGALPSVIETYYDIFASKKISAFFKERIGGMWTSTQGAKNYERYTMSGAAPDGSIRINPVVRETNEWLSFYTCDSREVD